MKNLKATYVEKVLRLFASGRFSASTHTRVSRWLVNGKDSEAKDEVLDLLWEESIGECGSPCGADNTAGDDVSQAFARWQGRLAASAAAANGDQTPAADMPPGSRSDLKAPVRLLRLWQSLAAVLIVALGALSWVALTRQPSRSPMTQVYCVAGKTKTVTLPDGSVVTLNGGSSVTYPLSFAGEPRREVLLMGEACFKVAKDKEHPFVVRGAGMDITALGTEFNVKAYPEASVAFATLLEGSVKVGLHSGTRDYILSPSEQISFNRLTGEVGRSVARTADVTAWQRGEIVFDNLTLAEILNELSNRFSHDFLFNPAQLPSDRFTFRFRKGMTLDEVMAIVSDVAGNIRVTIDDDTCKVRLKS